MREYLKVSIFEVDSNNPADPSSTVSKTATGIPTKPLRFMSELVETHTYSGGSHKTQHNPPGMAPRAHPTAIHEIYRHDPTEPLHQVGLAKIRREIFSLSSRFAGPPLDDQGDSEDPPACEIDDEDGNDAEDNGGLGRESSPQEQSASSSYMSGISVPRSNKRPASVLHTN